MNCLHRRGLAALVTGALPFCACLARAQSVAFELRAPFGQYVVGEPISVTMHVANHGPAPLVIDDYPPFNENSLRLELTAGEHKTALTPRRPGSMIRELMLAANEATDLPVAVDEWFAIPVCGTYVMRAVLLHNGRRYETNARLIEVVPGLELARVAAAPPDEPLRQQMIHLVYLARGGQEEVFLRSEDKTTGQVRPTLALGPIVRITPPQVNVSDDGTLVVRHQASRDLYLTTRVRLTGSSLDLVDTKSERDSTTTPLLHALSTAARRDQERRVKDGAPAPAPPAPPAPPEAQPPAPEPAAPTPDPAPTRGW